LKRDELLIRWRPFGVEKFLTSKKAEDVQRYTLEALSHGEDGAGEGWDLRRIYNFNEKSRLPAGGRRKRCGVPL